MGRWAQRKRSGGGPAGSQQLLISLVSAAIDDTTHATAVWSANVTAGDFDAGDFVSSGSQEFGVDVVQASPNSLTIEFSGVITGDTDFEYSGDTAGVFTPDTVAY